MRALIAEEKPAQNPFDVKTATGGMIDIEFIAQWATLRAGLAPADDRVTAIADLIDRADPALLTQDERTLLCDALESYNRVMQLVRLCMEGVYDPAEAPAGLSEIISDSFDLPTISAVEAHLLENQKKVATLFKRLIG